MTFRLYRTPIPDRSLTDNRATARSKLSSLGLLEGASSVEAISVEPADVQLDLQYRRRYAGRLALELAELLESQSLQDIPLAPSDDSQSEYDGYYAVQTTESGRVASQSDSVVEVSAGLAKEGTRSSQRRAIRCLLSRPDPGNTFGSALTALVGVPADATNVRWYDREFQTTASATVSSTVQARFGDVDLYDARDVNNTLGDDLVLVYQPASYDVIGDVDVGVWDTYGNVSPTDSDDVVQWGRVFSTEHDPRVDDELVIENGLLRLWVQDGPEQNIQADEWDPGTSSWSSISLPSSDWTLVETDLTRIGSAAVEAQCVFDDGSTTYSLDLRLERGKQKAQWLVPESVSSDPPSDLKNLLDAIADDSQIVTGAGLGLVARRKLRK